MSRRGKTKLPPVENASPLLAGESATPHSVDIYEAPSSLDGRDLLKALQALLEGDFSARLASDYTGVSGKVADAFNAIAAANQQVALQIRQLERAIGHRGDMKTRVRFDRSSGGWGQMEMSLNHLVEDLLWPTTSITATVAAVAKGDLQRPVPLEIAGRPLRGEFLRSANIVNAMIERLRTCTSEVTRVAREVGTEGRLGGQAQVPGVAGTWKDLTDSVNSMAGNLTAQVRNIAEVTTAVARGDLSRKITVDVKGEILELKNTINTMVDQLNAFASEVTRVAREVGTEGRLGGQAQVLGVAGTWKDLTDSVNFMASNLTGQVRNIAEVTTAVARGDLSRKITVDVKGEILELKNTINTMVDQLNAFASEVTRVAREVGTEGRLGGQAQVSGVAGTWKDLTDSVNFMASNLTAQVRNIAEVATAIANGDLSRKIAVDVRGEMLLLKDTLNTMIEQLRSFAAEVTRVARQVATEGRLGVEADVPGVAGTWKDLTDSVNLLAANLTIQVRNVAEVTTAVARGDLSKKITVDVKGEVLELKNTINTMVDQLNAFASEVTRVAREVGTEGLLGGQATVPGVAGTWQDLTDTVNVMAANLTEQVRGIAKVVTAVANGDLEQSMTVKSKGEVAALADTINSMTNTLAIFADQVTTVAHEVGVEGRLGGQANVPGAAGTWKDLTGNVNLLAANLTTQVRAIAEVATAVTKGDLTRSIRVNARGEVAELKDNINTMIENLRLTTTRNMEQDWLKTNLARLTNILQGQRDLTIVGRGLLSELAPLVGAQCGSAYLLDSSSSSLVMLAAYAYDDADGPPERLRIGQGLIGQCAMDGRRLLLTNSPAVGARISVGTLKMDPRSVIVLPILFEGRVKAVIELSSVTDFTDLQLAFLDQLSTDIGIVLNSIEVTMQTQKLLEQSQRLAAELQTQQKELQQTNEQLQQKAQELALASRYKSEFLANMSHELRTPLNSVLILGRQLAANSDGNLGSKQVEFARTIHEAGTDLLNLINDILDLSKVESRTVSVDIDEVLFSEFCEIVVRPFRHEAEIRRLSFDVNLDPTLDPIIATDSKRLQQVLKNLLSNAFKFTERGGVRFTIAKALSGWTPDHPMLGQAQSVVAFEVADTGTGIPIEKQKIIFEAFQQADASTSRKYGGTGLGLAISRELSNLLGGELALRSEPGIGSIFTLYLPLQYIGPFGGQGARTKSISCASLEKRPLAKTPVEHDVVERTAVEVDQNLAGKKALLVDDDVRNIFALSSFLEDCGMSVLTARTGQEAIDLLHVHEDVAIVLMDVMMPEMDGYETMACIRNDSALSHLPILAITAQAMKGDKEKCLEAGASDYLAKPIDTVQLLTALRSWLHSREDQP